MKLTLVILLTIACFSSKAQHSNDGKFLYFDDTTEVVNYLNGEWKFKIKKKSHTINFNFDTLNVSCIDSMNLHWYERTITKYQLEWDGCCRIFLNCYWFDSESNSFQDKHYPHELWLMNEKKLIVNFGGDFGVYILKKKRK